ncbi:LLM class F420-dependent oxidoreductase [Dactylosporangium sp. CS-033363]|uniref:LLM class F420-dependent oxidoreductase n=1 Tax=Dactylosporangium sp. CS-033363 TaxID=3239935 RepID=UPI003D8A52E9
MELKLGVMPAHGGADPATVARFVRLLEELGCESVWAVEHVVVPDAYDSSYPYDPTGRMSLGPDDDIPDPLHWLTFAAAHTTTLRLGTAMLILPEHNPVDLAKRLATVDVLSGGRLLAGIGVGWLREEYDALGVPFAERGARADEYLEAMRALWTQKPARYDGRFVSFGPVHSRPRPVRGTVPIVVGGHSLAAVRRAARLGDGWYPLGVRGEEFARLRNALREECTAAGRDPDEVEVTARAPGDRGELEMLRSLGVARVVIRADPNDLVGVRDKVRRYQREVLGA